MHTLSTCFTGAQHLGRGVLSRSVPRAMPYLVIPTLAPLGLLYCPLLGLHKSSDHTRPGPMGLSQSHPRSQPKPWSECTSMALGMWMPFRSHDDHIPLSSPRTPIWISSDHTQPGPMGHSQSHPRSQPKPW